MLEVVKSNQRYHFENDWLSTYWHFSFDHYFDPNNISFGPLRVFNDDTVKPGTGFPTHSHREMEILTYVLSGQLEHQDSAGHRGIIRAGEVQRMSASTGISHSERNPSLEDPVHFLQIWILPARSSLAPSWEQKPFSEEQRCGVLLPVASGQGHAGTVHIHQDATLYVSRLEPDEKLNHMLGDGRRAYAFVIDGEVEINESTLSVGDVAKVSAEQRLLLAASRASELILLDLP